MKSFTLFLYISLFVVSHAQTKKEEFARHLDSLFSAAFPANKPGAAVLVMRDENILFKKGYGIADVATKEKITPTTLFNLGSVSKTFVANAVLILQSEHKLSIYDHLGKYFPDFMNPRIGDSVQLIHMLSHTSGLPDNRDVENHREFFLAAKDEENWAPVKKAGRLNFHPGERFEYSNPAFNGLALIVEQVSKTKWQSFVKQRIFLPSGMTHSKITDGPYPQSGVSHGYIFDSAKNNFSELDYGEEPTFAAAGNGGVWSSVEELAKYELALRKGVFLDRTVIERSQEIFHPYNWSDSLAPRIGCSWFIGTTDNLKTVYHTGSQGGFVADYFTIPDKKILYILLCNTPVDVVAYRQKILGWLREANWFD